MALLNVRPDENVWSLSTSSTISWCRKEKNQLQYLTCHGVDYKKIDAKSMQYGTRMLLTKHCVQMSRTSYRHKMKQIKIKIVVGIVGSNLMGSFVKDWPPRSRAESLSRLGESSTKQLRRRFLLRRHVYLSSPT